jgi:hypothetical protein
MKTLGYKQTRKSKRIFEAYLKHKGYDADCYKFTTQLFKEPVLFVAGFKIAIERGVYLGETCVFYSLIC